MVLDSGVSDDPRDEDVGCRVVKIRSDGRIRERVSRVTLGNVDEGVDEREGGVVGFVANSGTGDADVELEAGDCLGDVSGVDEGVGGSGSVGDDGRSTDDSL